MVKSTFLHFGSFSPLVITKWTGRTYMCYTQEPALWILLLPLLHLGARRSSLLLLRLKPSFHLSNEGKVVAINSVVATPTIKVAQTSTLITSRPVIVQRYVALSIHGRPTTKTSLTPLKAPTFTGTFTPRTFLSSSTLSSHNTAWGKAPIKFTLAMKTSNAQEEFFWGFVHSSMTQPGGKGLYIHKHKPSVAT